MFRESVFVCSYRLNETLGVAHVRAWDEDEATEIFVQQLNEEGILDASDIRVCAVQPFSRLRAPDREPSVRGATGETGAGEGITPGP